MKRLFDILFALVLLALTLPLFLFALIGVKLSSSGPVFYPASRVGLNKVNFSMLKFRTMHSDNSGSVITSRNDTRIFWFGGMLRRLKIDELPQFINVLKGDMSIVGPRPEDPKIVSESYTSWMSETLMVRPGITSPGAVFYYAFGEQLIDDKNPEMSYITWVLPSKLAVDLAYLQRANLLSDMATIFLTAMAIIGQIVGKPVAPNRIDLKASEQWVPTGILPKTP